MYNRKFLISIPFPHRHNAITLYIRQILQCNWSTLIPVTVANIHYTLYLVGYSQWQYTVPQNACPQLPTCSIMCKPSRISQAVVLFQLPQNVSEKILERHMHGTFSGSEPVSIYKCRYWKYSGAACYSLAPKSASQKSLKCKIPAPKDAM